MGVQAGRLITYYKSNPIHQITNWSILGLVSLLLYFGLTQFDTQFGWIPANKNLGTFTFTLVTGASSYFIFNFLYIFIDLKEFWNGCPLIYLGMNSIVIYCCRGVFSNTLPIYVVVTNNHVAKLLINLWELFVGIW